MILPLPGGKALELLSASAIADIHPKLQPKKRRQGISPALCCPKAAKRTGDLFPSTSRENRTPLPPQPRPPRPRTSAPASSEVFFHASGRGSQSDYARSSVIAINLPPSAPPRVMARASPPDSQEFQVTRPMLVIRKSVVRRFHDPPDFPGTFSSSPELPLHRPARVSGASGEPDQLSEFLRSYKTRKFRADLSSHLFGGGLSLLPVMATCI